MSVLRRRALGVINHVFTCSTTSLSYSYSGHYHTLPIISTANKKEQGFSMLSGPSWITVSGKQITAAYNSGAARSGTVVLVQDGSGLEISISVSQAAYVEYSFSVSISGAVTGFWIIQSGDNSTDGYVSSSQGAVEGVGHLYFQIKGVTPISSNPVTMIMNGASYATKASSDDKTASYMIYPVDRNMTIVFTQ